MALWLIVYSSLGLLALLAVGVCAFGVVREGLRLTRQVSRSAKVIGEAAGPLTEALEQLGAADDSPARR